MSVCVQTSPSSHGVPFDASAKPHEPDSQEATRQGSFDCGQSATTHGAEPPLPVAAVPEPPAPPAPPPEPPSPDEVEDDPPPPPAPPVAPEEWEVVVIPPEPPAPPVPLDDEVELGDESAPLEDDEAPAPDDCESELSAGLDPHAVANNKRKPLRRLRANIGRTYLQGPEDHPARKGAGRCRRAKRMSLEGATLAAHGRPRPWSFRRPVGRSHATIQDHRRSGLETGLREREARPRHARRSNPEFAEVVAGTGSRRPSKRSSPRRQSRSVSKRSRLPRVARSCSAGPERADADLAAPPGERHVREDGLWPRDGITKQDLAEYFEGVAPAMLRALADRPLTLQHWRQGIDGPALFQQDVSRVAPSWMHIVETPARTRAGSVAHPVADCPEVLRWFAQHAALTIHTWASRQGSLESPDWLVFDLDPADGHAIEQAVRVALVLRRALEDVGLASFPKTSGQRGLHLLVPLEPGHGYGEVERFAVAFATGIARLLPEVTLERARAKRRGRLYLDCLQNGYGKTIVAPYSPRAVDGAPVSAPLRWSEVGAKLDPAKFTLRTMPARLDRVGDLFAEVLTQGGRLPQPPTIPPPSPSSTGAASSTATSTPRRRASTGLSSSGAPTASTHSCARRATADFAPVPFWGLGRPLGSANFALCFEHLRWRRAPRPGPRPHRTGKLRLRRRVTSGEDAPSRTARAGHGPTCALAGDVRGRPRPSRSPTPSPRTPTARPARPRLAETAMVS